MNVVEPIQDRYHSSPIRIPVGEYSLEGTLTLPSASPGLVIFAHGSGSSRKSARNRFVGDVLNEAGLGTLLFDLLTVEEEGVDNVTRELRFNIPLLAGRLVRAIDFMVEHQTKFQGVRPRLGLFGASTGAAAALIAAAERPKDVFAVVSRGGRPDLAGAALARVLAPTLLIVGERDDVVLGLNRQAFARLRGEKRVAIVPEATHLFEEPGTLEKAADLAKRWFHYYLSEKGGKALLVDDFA